MTIYGDNVNNDDYDNNVTGLAPYGARLRRKAMRLPCSLFLAPSKGLK